jgi:hypothetical protein
MTKDERVKRMLEKIIQTRFPLASASFIEANAQIQSAGDKRDGKAKLAEMAQNSRTKKSSKRITLRYRLCRVRPRDWDNAAGSTKQITDLLRRCGLIPGDSPENIKVELEQQKVNTYAEERTIIEIEFP